MGIFIAVIVVLLVLIYFMTIMLRSVVSESNQKVNGYFLKNLEMYDARYKEKVNALRHINVEYEDVSRELRNMKNEMISYKTSPFYAPRPVPRDIFIPTARYIDNDFFEEVEITRRRDIAVETLGDRIHSGVILSCDRLDLLSRAHYRKHSQNQSKCQKNGK